MAPEILDLIEIIENHSEDEKIIKSLKHGLKLFDWKKVDVFALGVTIFSCVFLTPPFKNKKASKKDKYYKYMAYKKYEEFWKCNK